MPDQLVWFRIGHVTNEEGRTGCTVILFDKLVPATVDVRGGAPGTRETALLGSGRLVGRADALLLTGGSAFGLAAADGVMRYLKEQGRGFPTGAMPVPIVPAAVIFDLANGAAVWPDADDGYQAVANAEPPAGPSSGRFGAGTGATVAKLGGGSTPGGIGVASVSTGEATVTAIVVLNALGDIVDPQTGTPRASAVDPEGRGRRARELVLNANATARSGENTTIGAVLVDGAADRDTLQRCCIAAHDGLARCVWPAHTPFDGDTFFAVARQSADLSPADTLR
ncbi:MAG TPA: P1 family peptidase, partial [Thermomicrobiales bacterium]|nr:P1 family peptidase [Thermomicrobiales bacterium]